jgi:DNA-directed RNA polymerase specialized sigma54-like protein
MRTWNAFRCPSSSTRRIFFTAVGSPAADSYAVIAQDIGVSESTISRVVKHKFAETPMASLPQGLFSSTAGMDDNYETIPANT